MLNRYKIILQKAALAGLLAFFTLGNAFAGPLDTSIAIEKKITKASVNSQNKVDRFADQTLDLASDYKSTLQIIESLQIYNAQLELLIESQEKEMVSIKNQMDTIDATERGVVPLMNEMIASLERFVQLDLPFHKEKRVARVARLKQTMVRADVSNSEKYRKILEAYQTEIAYGESVDSYQGSVGDIKVDFVRFGRVLLTFLTLDGKNAGYYNPETGEYEELDDEYLRPIEMAIKIASNQAAPELIKVPVPAAKEAN